MTSNSTSNNDVRKKGRKKTMCVNHFSKVFVGGAWFFEGRLDKKTFHSANLFDNKNYKCASKH